MSDDGFSIEIVCTAILTRNKEFVYLQPYSHGLDDKDSATYHRFIQALQFRGALQVINKC